MHHFGTLSMCTDVATCRIIATSHPNVFREEKPDPRYRGRRRKAYLRTMPFGSAHKLHPMAGLVASDQSLVARTCLS